MREGNPYRREGSEGEAGEITTCGEDVRRLREYYSCNANPQVDAVVGIGRRCPGPRIVPYSDVDDIQPLSLQGNFVHVMAKLSLTLLGYEKRAWDGA